MEIKKSKKKGFSQDKLPIIPRINNDKKTLQIKNGLTKISKEKNNLKIRRNSKKSKTTSQTTNTSSSLLYGEFQSQNTKFCNYMEDFTLSIKNFNNEPYRHLFGIFDGHGGDQTAKLCTKKYPEIFKKCFLDNPSDPELALKKSFEIMDNEIKEINAIETGNTATIVFINNKLLYCANVGDSSCCLISNKKSEFISIDDKLTNIKEVKRIIKCGGEIINGRLNGILAVTRGLGDFDMKTTGLICEPHIIKKLIEPNLKYCIIASDGLWDVLEHNDVLKIANDINEPNNIAKKLVEVALEKGSEDNISCVVVELNK